MNTSTYIFHADPSLAGGVTYTAKVNPGLTDANGMVLDASSQNVTWSFTTSMPQISTVFPDMSNGRIDLDAVIEVQFNQPMDRNGVESVLKFTGPDGQVAGVFVWNEKSSRVKYQPSNILKRDKAYALSVGASARSKGGAEMGMDTLIEYVTIPDFFVGLTSFPSGEVRPTEKGVVMQFSSPVALYSDAELQSLITVEPDPSYVGYYQNLNDINVNGGFEPGKSYTITFLAGLKDRWGQSLQQDCVFTFTEPDASSSLSYGSYIPVLFTLPDEPAVSVEAVNVDTMLVSSGSMSADDFFRMQTDYEYRAGYFPADIQTRAISPRLVRNDSQLFKISLSDGPLVPGFYFVSVESPAVQYVNEGRRALVVFSRSGLTGVIARPTSWQLLWHSKNLALITQSWNRGLKIT